MKTNKLKEEIKSKREELTKILSENTGYAISKKTGYNEGTLSRIRTGNKKPLVETVLDILEKWYR